MQIGALSYGMPNQRRGTVRIFVGVELDDADKTAFRFEIEPGDREQLLSGLDDIDLTLKFESDITRFEETHNPYLN